MKCPWFANGSFTTCWRPLAGPVAGVRPVPSPTPVMTECIKVVVCFSPLGHSMNFCYYQHFIHWPVQIQKLHLSLYTDTINSSNLIRHIIPEKEHFPNPLWKPSGHFGVSCQLKLDVPFSPVDHSVLKSSHRTRLYSHLWKSLGRINGDLS